MSSTCGMALIAAERRRQIEVEGYTPEHDREQGVSRLLRAAEAYEFDRLDHWPWDPEWWKPKDALSNLIRAGALYQAASDVSPMFDGAARAGVERCSAKIDAILTHPIVAARAEAVEQEAERKASIAVAREHHRMVERVEAAEGKVAAALVELAMSDHEPTNRVWHEQMQRVRAALGGEATP